jgi:hypothetical protein
MAGNDSFTKVLLHFDGTNGSTTITDDCAGASAHTASTYGTCSLSTSGPKFGTASLSCGGGNSGVLITDATDLRPGTGDFTIDFWINPSSLTGFKTLWNKGYNGVGALAMQTGNGNGVIIIYDHGSAVITASSAFTTGAWQHIALVRSGTTLTLYKDGSSVGSATNSTNYSNTADVQFGSGNGGNGFVGSVDELRFSNSARWTANFTPPSAAYDSLAFLTADVGSFSETGVGAIFSAKQLASAGSYLETGIAATFAARGLSSVGALAETGISALGSIKCVSAAASYSLTGNSAFMKPSLAASVGGFSVSMGSTTTSLDFMAAYGEYELFGSAVGGVFGIPAPPTSYIVTTFPAQFSTTMEQWTNQASGSESWTTVSGTFEIWTPQTSGSETWH